MRKASASPISEPRRLTASLLKQAPEHAGGSKVRLASALGVRLATVSLWYRGVQPSEASLLKQCTKGKRSRRIPMNEVVYRVLKARSLVPPSAQVFPNIDFDEFSRLRLRPLAMRIGVTPIRFHDLRHTFGSHLAMRGVPVLKIQALMGHSDIQTTMRCMHLAPAELEGVTEILLRKGRGESNEGTSRAAVP